MRSRTRVIAGISGALLVVVSGAAAFASIPDSDDGQIHACRQPVTGNLRVIDDEAGATCHSSEQSISWPSRAQSAPTLEVQTITTQFTVPANSYGSGVATCPSGTLLTGGGFSLGTGHKLRIVASTPNQPDTGWEVAVDNLDSAEGGGFIMARCASLG